MSDRLRKLLIIDNNDSFTYNVVDVLRRITNLHWEVVLHKDLKQKKMHEYDYFIISPGPGKPSDFKFMSYIISFCETNGKPLLGICLGHQAICEYYGAKLIQLPEVVHGRQMSVEIDNNTAIYKSFSKKINVGLYHSWTVDYSSLPKCILVIGTSKNKRLMSVKHQDHEIYGVQFHPESFMTENGKLMLENFLNI